MITSVNTRLNQIISGVMWFTSYLCWKSVDWLVLAYFIMLI
jgi:hypothetical protein